MAAEAAALVATLLPRASPTRPGIFHGRGEEILRGRPQVARPVRIGERQQRVVDRSADQVADGAERGPRDALRLTHGSHRCGLHVTGGDPVGEQVVGLRR